MKAAYINYDQTQAFSKTVISYLNGDDRLDPFINERADLNGFKNLLSKKKVLADRKILVEVLREQYNGKTTAFEKVSGNIKSLANNNTFTVTTGHQLNIFTGPLFFLFKIVHAINLAKQLSAEFPDKNFVPVYWMATEDHDFAEINHTNLHGKKISWDYDAAGPTGKISTETISETVRQYAGILGISENALKLSEIVKAAYAQSTLAYATRYLVNELFGQYGLVIIDADDVRFKKQFSSIIKKDILEQNSFREINEGSEKLHKAGFESQVHAREINFFYVKENFRERLVFENQKYFVLNSDLSFSPGELEAEIDGHPERFSPNVMMRPLYQEVILPNLAYIGGGAELVYWLQLKQNFDFYEVDFPILFLRNSALIADESTEAKLKRLNLNFIDLFGDIDKLKADWVKQNSNHSLNLVDEWQELRCIFEKIKLRAYKIDSTLAPSTEAVRERLHHNIQNLEKKLVKAEKRNYSTALSQIDAIKEKLFPNGVLQERVENFGSLYVKYGDDLIGGLIKNLHPLDFKFTILY
ncbi:bacillithiol biosynthesis cysteine-adding enzyme BshC [Pedobacter sp. HMF7647]|uniref:Putative cysteine ligase BshC n=1 Tax=Hufsiella arboris TaxID=2695275 RepID=A0A7K1YDI2_9SPHI|nr:bacillithiol biosynthesis cysteine-adding enzyme BshC [Hufsiella arboris]MXV52654.1 bacillithiol biosynthesis cysteine-adding enzyme BshC [Hufsiella arboris]